MIKLVMDKIYGDLGMYFNGKFQSVRNFSLKFKDSRYVALKLTHKNIIAC